MQIYPAIKARMGDWTYYVVRMTMREVAREVELAGSIWEDRTLSTAIQRMLDESRVKQQIVEFLSRRDDRFFSSLVVAAIGGNPSWTTVETPAPVGARALSDAFGWLSFDENPKYYALDGQHRLKAIKELLEDPASAPAGFDGEQVSVLVVVREEQQMSDDRWLQRYRRLFSSLNRYAKPTDRDTNIIMDEDDVFAIVTRRLVTEHEFFRAAQPEQKSFRVQTKGKNLKSGSPQFISLQTLYEANKTLLMTPERRRRWGVAKDLKVFLQFRPEEDEIDRCYDVLCRHWNGLLRAVPDLKKEPERMRAHALPEPNPESHRDDLRFWPIGQEVVASVARALLDHGGFGDESAVEEIARALAPIEAAPWELHEVPWRYLLLVPPDEGGEAGMWRMRSEDRKAAVEVARRLLRWIVRVEDLDDDGIDELRADWSGLLYPQQDSDWVNHAWREIAEARGRCGPDAAGA